MREEGLAFMAKGIGLISPPPEPAVLRALFTRVLEAFDDPAPPAGCALGAGEPLTWGLVRSNAATIAHATAALIAHRRITPAIALAGFQALAAALGQALLRTGPQPNPHEEAGAIGAATYALAQALGGPQAEAATVRFLLDFALCPPAVGAAPVTDSKKTLAMQHRDTEQCEQQALAFRRHALRGVLLALGGAGMDDAMRPLVAGYFLATDRPRLTSYE